MTTDDTFLLAGLFLLAAALYSSVGHAGASGYLAAMALVGMAPDGMRVTALALNVLVATIATVSYMRAGHFDWRTFYPFAVLSTPAAFVGGVIRLPPVIYKPAVGVILLIAAAELGRSAYQAAAAEAGNVRSAGVPIAPGVMVGGAIGLLSGLTGTGGGIFLSPVLLFTGWARTRLTSGVSAVFILVNSIAGLAGSTVTFAALPTGLPVWIAAALAGGLIGTQLGSPMASGRRIAPSARSGAGDCRGQAHPHLTLSGAEGLYDSSVSSGSAGLGFVSATAVLTQRPRRAKRRFELAPTSWLPLFCESRRAQP